jgi:hypothetical protein
VSALTVVLLAEIDIEVKDIGVVIVTILLDDIYSSKLVRVDVILKVSVGLVESGFVMPPKTNVSCPLVWAVMHPVNVTVWAFKLATQGSVFDEGNVTAVNGIAEGKEIVITVPTGTGLVKFTWNEYVVTAPTVRLAGVMTISLIGFGMAVKVSPVVI